MPMRVSTMRRVDRWVGVPVCFILTLHRRLVGWFSKKTSQQIRRILFVKLAEQGATVLAYPALARAVQMVGRENVFFMAFRENRFILDAMGIIPEENVIPISTNNKFRFAVETLRALRRTHQLSIDAAIDFEFFARSSGALSYLSGAPRRVGLHAFSNEASYRGDLMTHRISFNAHLHTSQLYFALVEALNEPSPSFPAFDLPAPSLDLHLPEFYPVAQELNEVKALLRKETGKNPIPPLILLNANAGDLLPLRRWPEERYVELSRRLLTDLPEIHIGFTGAPEEGAAAQQLVREIGSDRCICLAGKTTLRQLLVLYHFAEVLVTNDSGPAHFATLTPLDVVVLFGPETPALFAAQTPRTHVLWAHLVCSPCINAYNDRRSVCRNNICMQRISVDQVFEEVCRVYRSRKTGRGESSDLP